MLVTMPAQWTPCSAPPPLPPCCSGVAEMAAELYDVLQPHMEGARHVELAGHSLGGSLATLLALTAHLRLNGGLGASAGSSSSGGGGGSGGPAGGFASSSSSSSSISSSGGSTPLSRNLSVHCTTFGSPPVLALANQPDEDGRSILKVRGLHGIGACIPIRGTCEGNWSPSTAAELEPQPPPSAILLHRRSSCRLARLGTTSCRQARFHVGTRLLTAGGP